MSYFRGVNAVEVLLLLFSYNNIMKSVTLLIKKYNKNLLKKQ